MAANSQLERYQDFLRFIEHDVQMERKAANRKIFNVFFWCFILPALSSATLLLLIKNGVLPKSSRAYLDYTVLGLPVLYSLYVLSSEVLAAIPGAFRKGSIATSLNQAKKESVWRARVCEAMQKLPSFSEADWGATVKGFQMDIQAMKFRNRYLTGLAGAVFFLIMQGIDSISGPEKTVNLVGRSGMGWVESSYGDPTQFTGLALFLLLLFLSGSQTIHFLQRYLDCAELIWLDKNSKK